ncbi:MAG: PQQ-dependent sugar dehydrogenase [Ilumatobacter sp.]|jgi:glucose/arabinose dehydrogenase|uniref:PQQ-dependent sugar dehydrogenase n=1 Tax=Ilumatobacter sp. TaxID=1967498 RepID=UPI0039194CFA
MGRRCRILSSSAHCVAIALGVSVLVAAGTGPVPASALPNGFDDEQMASVSRPTTIEALPDGRVIVLEQGGTIKRIDPSVPGVAPTVTTVGELSVCSDSERGLLGFATDPAFFTTGVVYLYYTMPSGEPGGCHNRVSRFVMDENGLDRSSEQVLVDNISSVNGNHNGGDIEIGNDGNLYIAVGDAGRDPRGDSGTAGSNDAAQDMSLLNGKILRVDRFTGLAVDGNPFTNPGAGGVDCRLRGNRPDTPTTPCNEIFASGLRNPYRFAFDPNTSDTRFFINDVGQNTIEEVNEGQLNANYGWPEREGSCPQGSTPPCGATPPRFTDPIVEYDHDTGLYVTAGAFVPDGVWPEAYDGGYLFADGAFGDVWLRTASGTVDFDNPFLDTSRPVDMVFVHSADGASLWYVQQNGEVRRVTAPIPPTAAASGALRYEPLPSMDRRFDSREQLPAAPLRAGQTRLIDIDAPDGATAALVNLTLVRPASEGSYVTAFAPRAARPTTSNVNAPAGAAVGNASIIPVGDDGSVLLYTSVTSGVVVDVAGFFFAAPGPVAAGRFVAVSPQRLIDTRQPVGVDNEFAEIDGSIVRVPVTGPASIPDDVGRIDAIVVTIAGINNEGSPGGFATAFPSGSARPLASSVNVNGDADVRANLAVVPVSADGTIDVYLERIDNITIDVAGYFSGASSPADTVGRFRLSTPTREADSRTGEGAGAIAGFGDAGSVGFDPTVPDTASAIAQNLTLAKSGGRGFVTAYPSEPLPTVSSINASGPEQVRGALGFVALAEDGSLRIFSSVDNGLVIDSFGWFE